MVPFNDLDALEHVMFERGDRIAALLFEPVLGEGVIAGDAAFFAGARRLADRYGALLILDEVVSFRLGLGGYQSVLGVEPDLTTFGKIIGGGLPVGAVGGREDVMRRFAPDRVPFVSHSGTFNGNPLTMVAGLRLARPADRRRDRPHQRARHDARRRPPAGAAPEPPGPGDGRGGRCCTCTWRPRRRSARSTTSTSRASSLRGFTSPASTRACTSRRGACSTSRRRSTRGRRRGRRGGVQRAAARVAQEVALPA